MCVRCEHEVRWGITRITGASSCALCTFAAPTVAATFIRALSAAIFESVERLANAGAVVGRPVEAPPVAAARHAFFRTFRSNRTGTGQRAADAVVRIVAVRAATGGAVSCVARARPVSKGVTLTLPAVGAGRPGVHTRTIVLTLASKVPRGTLTARRTGPEPFDFILVANTSAVPTNAVSAVAVATALVTRAALALDHAVDPRVATSTLFTVGAEPKPLGSILETEAARAHTLTMFVAGRGGAVDGFKGACVLSATMTCGSEQLRFRPAIHEIGLVLCV